MMPSTKILDRMRKHLTDIDHHYCVLICLGLDMNRAVAAEKRGGFVGDETFAFMKEYAVYVRAINSAALMSDKAFILKKLIEQIETLQEEKKSCKKG